MAIGKVLLARTPDFMRRRIRAPRGMAPSRRDGALQPS